MPKHFPLHLHISSLFLLMILLVGGLIGGIGYRLSRDMLETTATDLVERISRETRVEIEQLVGPAEVTVQLMSHDALIQATSTEQRMQRLSYMREALEGSTALSSVYIGYPNGDFFMLRRILSETDIKDIPDVSNARYILQNIETRGGERRAFYGYLDARLQLLKRVERPDYARDYDPRGRSWYKQAVGAHSQIKTAPYVFFSNLKVGCTIAQPTAGGEVVAADILLDTLSANLAKQRFTPSAQLALVDAKREVLAHQDGSNLIKMPDSATAKPTLKLLNELGVPVLNAINALPLPPKGQVPIKVDDQGWRVTITPLLLKGASPLYLLIAAPDKELLAAAFRLRNTAALIMLLIIALAVPITWYAARAIAGPLRLLAEDAEAIRRFDFSRPSHIQSAVEEVNQLSQAMDSMKRTIRRFLDINRAVAAEEDFDLLLPRLLSETLSAAQAQGGVLYLADHDILKPVSALRVDGEMLLQTYAPPLPTVNLADQTDSDSLLAQALADGVIRAGALPVEEMAALGLDDITVAPDMAYGMVVPLLNRNHEVVGAMLLLGAGSDAARISFITALSGSAAVTLETRGLIEAQKALFEAFVKLIAGAIDAKSPYTGGHCARVPELTKMLARAACAETSGSFRDFQLGEQEWEAVHLGAWLHDCGKVITPEYVVDKATKLETIYDRIHEIRTRFEVLKRDAEIRYLQAMLDGHDADAARVELVATHTRLDQEFAFVASCNEGGEFMAPDKIERLRAIASQTWQRTLDDRLGIAHEEKARKARAPAVSLPATEALISDRPEHLFERLPQDVLTDDNPWGFRMPSPKLLYNRGELYNLSVARGTLSEEERYKINEHIVQTQIMLSQLPFPKHLREVPEIAGGHHEKMDGTGYPRRLHREDMSPVSRMMAIADIFEALTAEDRPYKRGKKLSEAIKIMSFMKKDQHIDGELFELFLRAGVHLQYAARFMRPEQVDDVRYQPVSDACQ